MQENSAKPNINYVSNPKERRKKVYRINSKIKNQNYKACKATHNNKRIDKK
jgi:hypothetical protein